MSHNLNNAVAVIGIDIGKNFFHVVGLDSRGAVTERSPARSRGYERRIGDGPRQP
jgi:transposase